MWVYSEMFCYRRCFHLQTQHKQSFYKFCSSKGNHCITLTPSVETINCSHVILRTPRSDASHMSFTIFLFIKHKTLIFLFFFILNALIYRLVSLLSRVHPSWCRCVDDGRGVLRLFWGHSWVSVSSCIGGFKASPLIAFVLFLYLFPWGLNW